jgi:hypothetical protein
MESITNPLRHRRRIYCSCDAPGRVHRLALDDGDHHIAPMLSREPGGRYGYAGVEELVQYHNAQESAGQGPGLLATR